MAEHTPFHLKNLELLREELDLLGLSLPVDEDLTPLAESVSIGDRRLANRFIVQPMEGFDPLDAAVVRGHGRASRGSLESQATLAACRKRRQLSASGRCSSGGSPAQVRP